MAAGVVNLGEAHREAARLRQQAGGEGPRLPGPGQQANRLAGRQMGIRDFQPVAAAAQPAPGMPQDMDPQEIQRLMAAALGGMPGLRGQGGVGDLGGLGGAGANPFAAMIMAQMGQGMAGAGAPGGGLGGLDPMVILGGMPGMPGAGGAFPMAAMMPMVMGMVPPEARAGLQEAMQDGQQRMGTTGLILTSTPTACIIALLCKNIMVINPMTCEYNPAAGIGEKMLARVFFLETTLHCLVSCVYNLCLTLITAIGVICTLGQVKPVLLACKKFIVLTGFSFVGTSCAMIGIAEPAFGTRAARSCLLSALENMPRIHRFVS